MKNQNEIEKEMLDDETKFLTTYYNKTITNKSKLIEDRLNYLKERLSKLKKKENEN